jgi:hypothetical protein
MSVSGGPSIVTSGLLLNLEPINTKSYSYAENLYTFSQQFDQATWTKSNVTYTANNITAPDGTLTGGLLQETSAAAAAHWLTFSNNLTANSTYTASCYFKSYSDDRRFFLQMNSAGGGGTGYAGMATSNNGTTILDSNASGDFSNGRFSITPESNNWVRLAVTWTVSSNVAITTRIGLFNVGAQYYDGNGTSGAYIWGAQLERNSELKPYVVTRASAINQSTVARDTISTYSPTLSNTAYYNFNSNGTFTFTRSTAPNLKDGGGLFDSTARNITAASFIYNDHTWEVWFKIDDINPGGYDVTEGFSVISVFTGYHQGFNYSSSLMVYSVWDYDGVTATGYNPCSWTVGTSGAQINQGNWYQIVVTNSNRTFTPYLNGVQLGTGSTVPNLRYNAGFNGSTIGIGKAYTAAAGVSSYLGYSRSTFGGMKMYNRTLTAEEIRQNFNASRGRYGL